MPIILAALCATTLTGCTTIILGKDSSNSAAQTRDIVSIGITRVIVPETQGKTIAFRRTGVGLGYGSAVGAAAWLGFDRNNWVIADPAKCQLMVVIRTDVEIANAAEILEKLEGVDVCYINETQP